LSWVEHPDAIAKSQSQANSRPTSRRVQEILMRNETVPEKYDDLLSPEQAAEILHKSTSTLSRWRAEKIGPAFIKNGGTIEYRRSDLEDYRLRCRKLAPALQSATAVNQ
jgi:Helix-turn-helix domain